MFLLFCFCMCNFLGLPLYRHLFFVFSRQKVAAILTAFARFNLGSPRLLIRTFAMKKQQTLSAFFGKPSSTVKAVEGSQPKISETKPVKSPEMHEASVAGTEDNKPIPSKRTTSDEDTPRKSKRSRKSVVVSDDENTETDEPGPSSSEGKVHHEQATKPSKMFDLFTNNSSSTTSKSPKKPSAVGKKASAFPDPLDRMDEDPKSEDNHNEDVAVANDTPSSSKAEDDVPDLSIAAWKKGEKVPYEALVKTFEAIDQTTKRLKIADILSSFFRLVIALSPEDLRDSIYLCVNKLAPEYEGVELGIGESLLVKAISTATGRTIQSIKTDYETEGDLGAVAQASRSMQKTMFVPGKLSVRQVYNTLKEIAMISGNSSMQKKVDKIRGLLVACRGNEAKFLIRSLEGKLRIGLAEQTVLAAIAQAFILTQKYPPGQAVSLEKNEKLRASVEAATQTLKQVFSELPNYDVIIPALLENEFDTLHSRCSLTPGIPVKPMLAHPTKSLTEVLDRFENSQFTCEFKYDGERNQIHKLEDGRVVIYSRNLENLTAKYPDLVDRLSKAPKDDVKSFILDCEAVAWDREEKRILPFQVLSTRKRKDVATEDVKVQVCLFAFDLLYLNGRPLIREPLRLRRQLLHDSFIEVEGQFSFARAVDASTVDEIQTFLDDSVKGNCEGLMVKTLDKEATYEPSKRSRNWLKVKKDYLGAMGDSVDLVVIGAFYGKGKRTGVYGGYLLACYDDDNEEYQSICKIGTGFSEAALEQHYQFFKDKTIPQPRSYYKFGDNVTPDVWFDVSQVWEVKAADLSISPVHRAAVGHVDPNKGISLRFPRFIRVREDKTPEIATNASQIAEMFRKQNLNTVKQADDPEDDY